MFNNSSFCFFGIEEAKYGISLAFKNTFHFKPHFLAKNLKQTPSQREKRFKLARKVLILLQFACWIIRAHQMLVGVFDG